MHPLTLVPVLPENSKLKFDYLLFIPTSAWEEDPKHANFDCFMMDNNNEITHKRIGINNYRIDTVKPVDIRMDYFSLHNIYLPRIFIKGHTFKLKGGMESSEYLELIAVPD